MCLLAESAYLCIRFLINNLLTFFFTILNQFTIMAYAQWINVEINPRNFTVSVKNARLDWGKFHANGNKDQEISRDDINRIAISDGNTHTICSCGRADTSSGTEGHFDLYDGGTKIGTFRWDNPWGSKRNAVIWLSDNHDDYVAQVTGGNLDAGAIGTIRIKVAKI